MAEQTKKRTPKFYICVRGRNITLQNYWDCFNPPKGWYDWKTERSEFLAHATREGLEKDAKELLACTEDMYGAMAHLTGENKKITHNRVVRAIKRSVPGLSQELINHLLKPWESDDYLHSDIDEAIAYSVTYGVDTEGRGFGPGWALEAAQGIKKPEGGYVFHDHLSNEECTRILIELGFIGRETEPA